MKKHILLLCVGIVCTFSAIAQNDIDAMRYSQLTFGGTARFNSMAGSMGALGGDISTLSFNPAGIGVFRKTELSISPSFFTQGTTSVFNGKEASDRKININLGNIGLVATFKFKEGNHSGWESLNFGFGYNRTNNFNNRISIQGDNKTSSLLDTYVSAANGYTYSSFDAYSTDLAYRAYLINPIAGDTLHYNQVIKNYGEQQRKSVDSKGGMGETDISFGGNYKNILFIGGSIGIVNVKYIEESIYEETDVKDTIANFKSFSFKQDLTTKGTGFNLKMGVIVKPNDWFRIGAAIHTPTTIGLTDTYNSSMNSDLDNGITYQVSPDKPGKFDYTVTTPYRAMGSLGFIIKKIALLNVDYEYVDYSFAQLNSKPNVFSDVNAAIRDKYTAASNLRIGGEVRMDPLAFRFGYARYGSPFKVGDNQNANRTSITTGIGYRQDNFFIDMAYIYSFYKDYTYLYNAANLNAVESNYRTTTVMFTVGVRF